MKDERKSKLNGTQQYKKIARSDFTRRRQIIKIITDRVLAIEHIFSKTFMKQNRVVQPLYGREITE